MFFVLVYLSKLLYSPHHDDLHHPLYALSGPLHFLKYFLFFIFMQIIFSNYFS